MKHLSRFDQFVKINEEEGWKENIMVGLFSLLGVSAMGKEAPSKQKVHVKSEKSMQNLLKSGWSLDSVTVDTLFNKVKQESPNTELEVSRLKLDKDQYFESGKFQLSEGMKTVISNSLDSIVEDGGLITDVVIVSSTDKQGLSTNLQSTLKGLGYSPDNKGLSSARAEAISDYLKEFGINDSLIEVNEKFEQGGEGIDQSARFVSVDIYYIDKAKVGPDPEEKEDNFKINKNYYLSKENPETDKTIEFGSNKSEKVKLGKISDHKRGDSKTYKCTSWGKKIKMDNNGNFIP